MGPASVAFFSYKGLKHMQKRLGHPHADMLYNVLKCAEICNIDYDTRTTLEDITLKCKPCTT